MKYGFSENSQIGAMVFQNYEGRPVVGYKNGVAAAIYLSVFFKLLIAVSRKRRTFFFRIGTPSNGLHEDRICVAFLLLLLLFGHCHLCGKGGSGLMRIWALAAGAALASASVKGQDFSGYNYTNVSLGALIQPTAPRASDFVTVGRINSGNVANLAGLSLSAFASASDVARLDTRIDGIGGANSSALVAISNRLDRLNNRFSEGIALVGSFNVLPPNQGDRFAVSVGGAGYNGAAAASISASARIDESTIVYGGVAQGPTQTMVKGGMGWSFK